MGIIPELKETYEYYKFLDKCSLNKIIAESISDYVKMYLLEEDKEEIINKFGSIDSFTCIMAENFTRNEGKFLITEDNVNEFAGFVGKLGAQGIKQAFKWGVKGGLKKGISQGVKVMAKSVSKRLGSQGAKDVLNFVGKRSMGRITFTDLGKYASREVVKGAAPKLTKQLEKQGIWLAKNTGMDGSVMTTFMNKFAIGPTGCDSKLWTKAFKNVAKRYHGGMNLTDDLVVKEYNILASKAGKSVIGNIARKSTGSAIGAEVGNAANKSFARKVGGALLKSPIVLANGAGKILKKAGMFCLKHTTAAVVGSFFIYQGWLWIKGEDCLLRRITKSISNGSGNKGNSTYGSNIDSYIYPKVYGKNYIEENPEDYRII